MINKVNNVVCGHNIQENLVSLFIYSVLIGQSKQSTNSNFLLC